MVSTSVVNAGMMAPHCDSLTPNFAKKQEQESRDVRVAVDKHGNVILPVPDNRSPQSHRGEGGRNEAYVGIRIQFPMTLSIELGFSALVPKPLCPSASSVVNQAKMPSLP